MKRRVWRTRTMLLAVQAALFMFACATIEKGHPIFHDEGVDTVEEVIEDIGEVETEPDEDLVGDSLDAVDYSEVISTDIEVCEPNPDSFIFCCSFDEECVGKLVGHGEDQCNPAVCKGGVCVVVEAEPGTECDDRNVCTVDDHCDFVLDKMSCVSGRALDCDDKNMCTTDTCDPDLGCVYVENDLECAPARCEGLKFYEAVRCSKGACPEQVAQDCDDNNQCTDDFCDPSTGCKHSPNPDLCVYYFLDMDQDGYGVTENTKCLCSPIPPYSAAQGGDCDDYDASIKPGALEVCNTKDDNCDGRVDEEDAFGCIAYYYDGDRDGYGVSGSSKCLCSAKGDYRALVSGDCDDGDETINPGATEKCNLKDDDCDGETDEERTSGQCDIDGYKTFYYDEDDDTYGVTGNTKCLCSAFGNYKAAWGGDCDDSDPNVNPEMVEVCDNGKDDDCDATTDENQENAVGCVTYYYDGDNDSYGVTGDSKCLCTASENYTATRGEDCDDTDDRVYPSGAVCGKDGDCDGFLLDPGETCDDGNNVSWDGCTECRYLEFQVNTWTSGNQLYPSITSLPSGGFVVVWHSDGQDGSGYGVYGQRFDSNGNKVGSEFQVNTWTTDNQSRPSVASLPSGGFVVVWHSNGQDGSSFGVYGQRFDSNGNKVGSEFQVNTWTTSDQLYPSVASLPSGGFVVAWHSKAQDGSGYGVYGQRFDSNGDKVGSEFQVNTWTTGSQEKPSITSVSNGGFVVAWHSEGQDGSGYGVYAQRFDSNGDKLGSEFQVNTWTTDSQSGPSVASLSNGWFVVVWHSRGQDGSSWGVYGQRFDSNGNKVGSEFQVNTWTTDHQERPSVASLPSGGFVVAWSGAGQGDSSGVYGQRFDSNGNKVGSEFQVNTWTTDWQAWSSVASLPSGGFVVVWQSDWQDGSSTGVYGQRFDSNGNKVGSEFRVNTWTTNSQWRPSVASLPGGGFVVVWQSWGQDGYSYGVYGQRFDSNGNKVGSEFQVNTWTTDYQESPSVAPLPSGGFVVVWQSGCTSGCTGQDGSEYGVYGRIFSE